MGNNISPASSSTSPGAPSSSSSSTTKTKRKNIFPCCQIEHPLNRFVFQPQKSTSLPCDISYMRKKDGSKQIPYYYFDYYKYCNDYHKYDREKDKKSNSNRGNLKKDKYDQGDAPPRVFTILFSHANAEEIGRIINSIKEFGITLKVNVLCYEYSGYGQATGKASEENTYEDIHDAYKFLIKKKKISDENIIVFGRSLGTGPSLYLAEKCAMENRPLGGVILQSAFTSIYRIALPLRFDLPGDMYNNLSRIANIKAPLFLIHGVKDELIPIQHSQELFLRCPVEYRHKPHWVEDAGHNNIENILKEEGNYYMIFEEFLDLLNARRQLSVRKNSDTEYSV